MAKRSLFQARHGRHRRSENLLRRTGASVQNEQNMNETFVEEQAARLGVTVEQIFDAMMLREGDDARFTFEDVIAATDGADIGLPPSVLYIGPGSVEAAILTDAADQQFFRAEAAIGITNTFTIRTNTYFAAPISTGTEKPVLVNIFTSGEGSPNNITIDVDGNGDLKVFITSFEDNDVFNAVYEQSTLIEDGYNDIVLVRPDEIGENIVLYLNGAVYTPKTIFDDLGGDMTDTTRQIFFYEGSEAVGRFNGFASEMEIWDVALSAAEVAYINANTAGNSASGYLDLSQDQGDYVSSDGLLGWYPLGFTTTPGQNESDAGASLDLTPTGIVLTGTPLP